MKIQLSKFDGMILGAFVLTGVIGAGLYFWSSSQLKDLQDQLSQASSHLNQLVSGRYMPDARNIKMLNENNKILKENLEAIETKLKASDSHLSDVQEKNPVIFKQDLNDVVQRLTAEAKSNDVVIPANFYFGFSRYLQSNPTQSSTLVLGKQLFGVERVCHLLFSSGITRLNSVARTFDEDGTASASDSPGNTSPDRITGKVASIDGGLYTVYPLQFEFTCYTGGLRKFLSNLISSPNLFIVRSIQISNSKPVPPRLDDMIKALGVTTAAPDPMGNSSTGKGLQPALGMENLRVKARIDLIEWTGSYQPAATAPAKKKNVKAH